MLRRTARLAFVLTTVLLAAGCVTRRPIVGRDISAEHVREIYPGSTRQHEVVAWFGAPDRVVHQPDGTQDYQYSYTGWQDRRLELLVYSRTTTEKEHKSLSIRMQDGVVIQVRYTNSANAQQNLSR
jgi:outer membrane protein assembly factor BamE (lipoprotein component of BamABCDE complex)